MGGQLEAKNYALALFLSGNFNFDCGESTSQSFRFLRIVLQVRCPLSLNDIVCKITIVVGPYIEGLSSSKAPRRKKNKTLSKMNRDFYSLTEFEKPIAFDQFSVSWATILNWASPNSSSSSSRSAASTKERQTNNGQSDYARSDTTSFISSSSSILSH